MEAAVGYANQADNLMATELTLGLPGTAGDDGHKATPPCTPRGKKRASFADAAEDAAAEGACNNKRDDGVEAAPPAPKAQVVGWPPVRSYRKSCFQQQASSKAAATAKEDAAPAPATPSAAAATNSFVKVSMDGAPYLRKVDLRMYKGYRELREALEAMFASPNSAANLSEFAVTYQDKDGDLMLVGDVPFEMFAGTCKKLRIMKRSEATGLGSPRQMKI